MYVVLRKTQGIIASLLAALAFCATSAHAGWSVEYLHPAGAARSVAWAVSGSEQVGTVDYHAACWNSTSHTWVDLNPAGSGITSEARGAFGGRQVGTYNSPSGARACYWQGSAASCVSLHPAGASNSRAYGTWGNIQVGEASVGGGNCASMWRGTPESWVNLHPAGATTSIALGASGEQQYGEANFGGNLQGGYWTGSASSWVSLSPTGCMYASVRDGDGSRYVGHATLGGRDRALLWRGSANDYVNLSPGTDISSYAFAMCGNYQVGNAFINLRDHASIWMGTAESWFDLHSLLPADVYTSSSAYGVDIVDGNVVVVGQAWNNALQRAEAVAWYQPVPEPSCIVTLAAGLASLGLLRRRR